ncbi:cupin [Aureibacter tunicatorum]|uniref:Quercetin dioxygenase-like cupin family protein n=1 Tax=Aureibacter tunicatorum TaxID=866807 RepID=A0AAE3XRR2_9BACT|nr:cupin [Aureibacter tunicatorum]MDR6240735.1 quercetin dioxygenase-like cupin family protein [Aureibacter tunicatorum]BDD06932.1 cupin [Aureibacter tunicatorum]
MEQASLIKNLEYNDNKPAVSLLFENEVSKEVRILMKSGQIMKEHKTSYQITVELFEGKIEFGVNGKIKVIEKGDILSLASNTPHDLRALENSIIRLSLSKNDFVNRVKDVANS